MSFPGGQSAVDGLGARWPGMWRSSGPWPRPSWGQAACRGHGPLLRVDSTMLVASMPPFAVAAPVELTRSGMAYPITL